MVAIVFLVQLQSELSQINFLKSINDNRLMRNHQMRSLFKILKLSLRFPRSDNLLVDVISFL